MLLFKRGPKAPRRARRAPKPSAGARRRGAERPELLVNNIFRFIMPTFESPTDNDHLKLEEGGGLAKGTIHTRQLVFGHFVNFVAESCGQDMEEFDLKRYYEDGHLTDAGLFNIFKK